MELLAGPLEHYAAGALKVSTKEGGLVSFRFNQTQQYIDALLEKQLEETKRVRAIILKGRKVGVSTYVAARFFRRAHALMDQSVYILSHEESSALKLFNIPKRFYNNLQPGWKPIVGRNNDDALTFPVMRCEYAVGTAGGKGAARSQTNQCFHGSEVGFWPNAGAQVAGALETVGDVDGTEIILESTANGIGNKFYEIWQQALAKEGDYQAIFVPWFWDMSLRRRQPIGWQPVGEEIEYRDLYGLTPEQMFWMHNKNIALGGTTGRIGWTFRQEYPGNAQEAFQSTGGDGLIKPDLVTKARHAIEIVSDDSDARVMGVDTAQSDVEKKKGDSSCFVDRQGRRAGGLVFEKMKTANTMAIVHKIQQFQMLHSFHMIFIDTGFNGKAIYDRLCELGYKEVLTGVSFGGEPEDPVKYMNKRAEIYDRTAKWFELPGGTRCPDDNEFQMHTCMIRTKPTSEKRMQMLGKKELRKMFGCSPDWFDSLATTFAEKIIAPEPRASTRRFSAQMQRVGRRRSWQAG